MRNKPGALNIVQLCKDFIVWRNKKLQATKKEKEIKSKIIAHIGQQECLYLPSWGTVTYKRSRPKTETVVDLDLLQSVYPEAYQACVKIVKLPRSRKLLPFPGQDRRPHVRSK